MARLSIIIVADEGDLRDSMCGYLAAKGFEARGVDDGKELDRAWSERPADILVLDVNLPGESGLSIATRMRTSSRVGIIMLAAPARTNVRVAALESGADTYLAKPVVLRELFAAVRAVAWRLAPAREETATTWTFDRLTWRLIAPNGVEVVPTSAEFSVLNALAHRPATAVRYDDLFAALGKAATDSNRRSLDSVLSRLRRKVEEQTGLALPVKSVRSVGYTFTAPLRTH